MLDTQMKLANRYGITIRPDAPADSLAARIAASHGMTTAQAHEAGQAEYRAYVAASD
jgi:hypothetical protein